MLETTTAGPMTKEYARSRWGWRLWAIASLLFLLAAWQQPAKRAGSIGLAVVFGIIAARVRAGLR